MPDPQARRQTVKGRILVVANETAASTTLCDLFAGASGEAEVLVVAPALSSRLDYWSSDDRRSRKAAELRVSCCLSNLANIGLRADGIVGDADPLQAIEDALRFFPADTIILSTHHEGRSNWLARDIVARARLRFPIHVIHVIVGADRELLAA